MKKISFFTAAIAMATTLLVGCDTSETTAPTDATPLGKTTQRSITEFVDAQGTFCFPDGSGGCLLFVAPLENFLGWSSPTQSRSASIDYAGIANRWLEAESGDALTLGTTFEGSVSERTLDDGRALVSVNLKTKNALAWAIDGYDYAGGPLLFGYRAADVLAGATPSLGSSHLTVDLILAHPGDPLPDLLQILAAPESGQEVRRITFNATAKGSLRAPYGVTDGTGGTLQVTQIGAWQASSHSPNWDGFPAEHVNLSVGN